MFSRWCEQCIFFEAPRGHKWKQKVKLRCVWGEIKNLLVVQIMTSSDPSGKASHQLLKPVCSLARVQPAALESSATDVWRVRPGSRCSSSLHTGVSLPWIKGVSQKRRDHCHLLWQWPFCFIGIEGLAPNRKPQNSKLWGHVDVRRIYLFSSLS